MALAGGGLIPGTAAETLAGAAVLTSAINIGGGFTITQARGRGYAILYLIFCTWPSRRSSRH
jgi:hypothetical protein